MWDHRRDDATHTRLALMRKLPQVFRVLDAKVAPSEATPRRLNEYDKTIEEISGSHLRWKQAVSPLPPTPDDDMHHVKVLLQSDQHSTQCFGRLSSRSCSPVDACLDRGA